MPACVRPHSSTNLTYSLAHYLSDPTLLPTPLAHKYPAYRTFRRALHRELHLRAPGLRPGPQPQRDLDRGPDVDVRRHPAGRPLVALRAGASP